MKTFVFFTLRNWNVVGGGSIRIYGIVNALAKQGHKVILISGIEDYSQFHPSIEHIRINNKFTKKAQLQGLISILPAGWVFSFFSNVFNEVLNAVKKVNVSDYQLYSFEYLDNSIAYVLKKTGKIDHYYNDIHGISTIEFDYQKNTSPSLIKRIQGHLKYFLATIHDKKIFENADGIIFGSKAMKMYFAKRYNISDVKSYILPYLISKSSSQKEVDNSLLHRISASLNISSDDFTFFFAGGYKLTSGIDDLVSVFCNLSKKFQNLKLILIGDGPLKPLVINMIEKEGIADKVSLIKSIPYEELKTYQNLGNVIVCPDRYNEFSDLIIHLKYLDSLVSGRIVVNGSFSSLQEINKDDRLSVSFIPSDINDLEKKLEYCIINRKELEIKYKDTSNFASENLTYESFIQVLTE